MLGHLFFEHLLKDGLHTLTYSGLDIQLHIMLELVVLLRGQVPPFSLNPQPTRHYPDAAHDLGLDLVFDQGIVLGRFFCDKLLAHLWTSIVSHKSRSRLASTRDTQRPRRTSAMKAGAVAAEAPA